MNEAMEQAGRHLPFADRIGNHPDRPVSATATRSLFRSSTFESAARPFLRLQRRNCSDPKMHRANSEAQKECEWKRVWRVAIPQILSNRVTTDIDVHTPRIPSKTGLSPPAVNGRAKKGTFSLDEVGPSHGTNAAPICSHF